MKKVKFIIILILCQTLFFCHSKTEKIQKQPEIYFNNQNYKYDDDELLKREHENKKRNEKEDTKHKVNTVK